MFSTFGEKHEITDPQNLVNHKQENYNENHTSACYSQTDKTKKNILKAFSTSTHYTQEGYYCIYFKGF